MASRDRTGDTRGARDVEARAAAPLRRSRDATRATGGGRAGSEAAGARGGRPARGRPGRDPRRAVAPTAQQILDIAERLVQVQGFNGFSYADISDQLGITKASLHYHFPTKATLGATLIGRYHEAFMGALTRIDTEESSPKKRLRRYIDLYAGVLRADRMCLCGMLAAEYATLPDLMRGRVQSFFDDNEAWLAHLLEEGQTARELRFGGSASAAARMLLGALEGAMMVARSYAEPARFSEAAALLVSQLEGRRR
jgi:TetR/AcrR family transcriptional regulator, transcriptional repressor for nem operon